MIADAQTAERIGQTWLRAALAPAGDFGRRAQDRLPPFGPGDEAATRARCAEVVVLAGQLAGDGVATLRNAIRRAPDPAAIVSRAVVGDPLADVDFYELGRFADALDAVARAWDAAGGPAAGRPPVVAPLTALLAPGRTGAGFYLADAFDARLPGRRAAYGQADAALAAQRERLAAELEPLLGFRPDGEEFIAMRDSVPGVPPRTRIVRETPAYRLLTFAWDDAALAAAARRDAALDALATVEDDVRRMLAGGVARLSLEVRGAADALGDLDLLLARVAFTQRWGGCVPELDPARFALTDASFVPLRQAREEARLPYVPISLELARVAVLTGPNMGGKSAALATCGFIAACLAAGVPPPARHATLPLLGSVAWIGGESSGDRARLLSSFGGEIVRTTEALAGARPPALLLFDEFARTTGPREGRALLVAVLEALAARDLFALAATHFEGVARTAGVRHLAIAGLRNGPLDPGAARDLHAALDAVAAAMDYRVVAADDDAPGASDALALSGLLGLDASIVARATAVHNGATDRAPLGAG